MKWQGRRESQNIEDRRTAGVGRTTGGIGIVGLLVVLVIGYVFGVDVTPLLEGGGQPASYSAPAELTQADKQAGSFVAVTLADTEEIWAKVFRDQLGETYVPPVLVLFKGRTQSACGGADMQTGPFYCPVDQKVYLDTDFFTTMERQLGASGDFAQAYVVAHEVGHHVQNLLGILGQTNAMRQRASTADANAISVLVELQADCLAGIWAAQAAKTFGTIERGDVEEAMNAARQIGDDTLQRAAGRNPVPDSFTHGTSRQRADWLMRGMKSGKLSSCDTFRANG